MIKHKIFDSIEALKRFSIKVKNTIRYGNLNKHINPMFGNAEKLIAYNKNRATGPEPCVCYAPTRSLYFDRYGNATACCFNRVHKLGKYPENSISEIISSEKRKLLQKELCRQNFMYGCQHCHKLIESENFDGVEARLYDTLKHQPDTPSEIIFELDNICNLQCAMCHEDFSSSIAREKGIKKIESPYNQDFIAQLEPLVKNLKVAKFLGGEPFLIPIYYDIWDMIIKINPKCKINLQTNGTIYNNKIEEYLKKGNFYIGVSIDSMQNENFERIRKNAKLDIVLENLDKFIKILRKKNNHINLSVCPMQQNIKEIPKIVEFCNSKNIFIYFNTVYTEGFTLSEMSEDKILEIIEYFDNYKIKANGIIARRNIHFYDNLKKQIKNLYTEIYTKNLRYKKRHNYSSDLLKQSLLELAKDDEFTKKVILEVFNFTNKDFLVSDAILDNIKNINLHELSSVAKHETTEQIREKVFYFIENGEF